MLVINFHLLCTAFGLSVLLILAECQNKDSTEYQNSVENSGNIDNFNEGKEHQYVDISKILEKTRRNITAQLQNYNFTYSGVHQLEDLVLESGGQPLRSLIVSTWRSGSSFLAEIVNAMQGNFYNCEPFIHHGSIQLRGTSNIKMALKTVKNRFNCNFDDMEDFFQYLKDHRYYYKRNTRLYDECQYNDNDDLCYDVKFNAQFCKLFPFLSMKVVRVRLHNFEEILQDKEQNVKVVFLVRDPRGVMRSRFNISFCPSKPDCSEPEILCSDMVSDYVAARRLLKKYPDRLMVLRFEELALNPFETIQRLFEFFGREITPQVEKYLITHTNAEKTGVYSTQRVSSEVPYKWKYELPYEDVAEIQLACQDAMDLWGYRMAYNASHMASKEFNPVGNYTFW